MQKLLVLILLTGTTLVADAQSDAAKYASTISASDLRVHLEIVAGAAMEGRETASPGQKRAAAYLADQFHKFGLKPGNKDTYQQVFSLMEDSIMDASIVIDGKTYNYGSDFSMAARISQSRSIRASSIVFAGYGISDSLYDDYNGLDVSGAVVVLAQGEPKAGENFIITGTRRPSAWSYMSTKMEAAYQKGAAAVFVVSPRLIKIDSSIALVQRKTGIYFPSRQVDGIANLNYATISHSVFNNIFGPTFSDSMVQRMSKGEPFSISDHRVSTLDIRFDYKENSYEKASSSNVLAVVEGTDKKDEYVFITAHYDHLGKKGEVIYYGADDDGSGTVAVLEIAEAFAKAKSDGKGPRRSMVFMAVSGEENGLWGSAHYCDYPIFPLENTTVNLNIDMIGRIDPKRKSGDPVNYVYVIGDDKISSDLKPISEAMNTKYTGLELDYKYNDPADPERIFYRSDHYNFARKGVPILFYFNGTHADYHRPSDTIEKIHFELMEKRARLVFHTAWEMANRDEMLRRDIPLK